MSDTPQATPAAVPPATPAQPAPAQPQPIEVKTSTGQVYRGANYEEVVQQLVQAQENATQRIYELSHATQPPTQPATQPEQWNAAKYYELLAQDPMEASRYQRKFDPEYQQIVKMAEQVEEYAAVNTFKMLAPTFPETNEAAKDALLEQAGKIMAETGRQKIDAYTLLAAHNICLQHGKYQPVTQEIVQPGASATPPPPPPPPPGSSAAAAPDLEQQILNAKSVEEARAIFEQAARQ